MAVSLAELESLPETELETMHESEFEFELNPVRKVYPDALMEHMAHMVMEAESEQEAAEGFLPLIPLIAGKLLPLAAKATKESCWAALPHRPAPPPRILRPPLPQISRPPLRADHVV